MRALRSKDQQPQNVVEQGVGASPKGDRPSLAEPEPPEQGGELLPFVMRWKNHYEAPAMDGGRAHPFS